MKSFPDLSNFNVALWICVAKLGPLKKTVRMLLFLMDQRHQVKKIYAVLAAAFAMVVVRFVFKPQLSLTI